MELKLWQTQSPNSPLWHTYEELKGLSPFNLQCVMQCEGIDCKTGRIVAIHYADGEQRKKDWVLRQSVRQVTELRNEVLGALGRMGEGADEVLKSYWCFRCIM